MSPHNTRARLKSTSDCCLTCNENFQYNESSFDCFACACRLHLHLTKNCTSLNETASKGISALGKNCFLLCNLCVSEKRDQITTTQSNESQNTQMEYLESELVKLKKNVTELKSILMKNETRTASPRQSDVSQREEKLPPRTEELDGIRICGIPELKEKNGRLRNEHDYSEVQKILSHLEVNAEIGDIVRLGQYEEKKTQRPYQKYPTCGSGERFYPLQ